MGGLLLTGLCCWNTALWLFGRLFFNGDDVSLRNADIGISSE